MSDLISRAALFNSIATAQDKAEIFAAIQNAPAVDAVEVVRCKDCKYCMKDDENHIAELVDDYLYCDASELLDHVNENDYCSYGERRDEVTE